MEENQINFDLIGTKIAISQHKVPFKSLFNTESNEPISSLVCRGEAE